MNYYHYTKGSHLAKIVNEGIIRTSSTLIEKKEKPAVWLTTSPEWEQACNIGKVVNTQGLVAGRVYSSNEIETVTVDNNYMKKEIGMCRIIVSEKLSVISWAKFKHVSRISVEMYNAIDSHSRSIGSPVNQWYCLFNGIPRRYWEGVEMFVDDQWIRWDEKISIEEFIDICMSCSAKQATEEILKVGLQNVHAQCQNDFIEDHYEEIIRFWDANKHKKGYIEIFITPDYRPHPCGFEFIEKRIRKTSFKPFGESKTYSYALVHFFWEATLTQYQMAVAC